MKDFLAHAAMALVCGLLLLAGSCSPDARTRINDTLREAEMAVAAGDMVSARAVADKLGGDTSTTPMSATQLCRLSIIYMQLAEQPGYSDLMANAAQCYRRAYEENEDSARMFYTGALTPEQAELVRNLRHIVLAGEAEYNHDDSAPDSTGMAVIDSIANSTL